MIQITLKPDATFLRLGDTVARAVQSALKRTGDDVFDLLYTAADKHTDKGDLIKSLKAKYTPGLYAINHDLTIAPHAEFVHWGSPPHVIRPSKRKALRFPVGGAFAFARMVNHPGYKGDPYFVTIATPQRVTSIFDAFLSAGLPK